MIGRKVFVVAQKETADHLSNNGFLVLLVVYTAIVFASTYMYGSLVNMGSSEMLGSINVKMISQFVPLIGILMGFDAIAREWKSGSLNVLLTHPLFRDNIIAGKIIGSMLVLAIIIVFSVFVSVGTLLVFYGVEIECGELSRIVMFTILTFFYASIFLGLAIFISTITKNANDSLVINVVIWLFACITFGAILKAFIAIVTGQSYTDSLILMQLLNLSPIHHYAQATVGVVDFSFGGVNAESGIAGVFDTKYAITQCLNEFWVNIAVLVVTPVILFVASFIAFLRKDITL